MIVDSLGWSSYVLLNAKSQKPRIQFRRAGLLKEGEVQLPRLGGDAPFIMWQHEGLAAQILRALRAGLTQFVAPWRGSCAVDRFAVHLRNYLKTLSRNTILWFIHNTTTTYYGYLEF